MLSLLVQCIHHVRELGHPPREERFLVDRSAWAESLAKRVDAGEIWHGTDLSNDISLIMHRFHKSTIIFTNLNAI